MASTLNNTSDSKDFFPVNELFIVTAGNCGACREFYKNTYASLLNKLRGKVNVTEIKFDTMSSNPPANAPSDITKRYIRWFPMFILFTPAEKAQLITGKTVDGHIMNGNITSNGQVEMSNKGYVPKVDSIYKWIEDVNSEHKKARANSNIVPLLPTSKENDRLFIPTPPAKEQGAICSVQYIPSKKI